MYYVLGCFGPRDRDRAGIGDILNADVEWQCGSRFEQPPAEPVEVELNPDFPGEMMPMFDEGILLFSDEMIEGLHAAGVDNLDLYAAVIIEPTSGRRYTNYKAVNVIGVIECADLSRSDYQAPSGSAMVDTDFDSLTLDESRIRGPLMFRLAECVTAIVVHETVRAELERRGIPYLDFDDPKDWVG